MPFLYFECEVSDERISQVNVRKVDVKRRATERAPSVGEYVFFFNAQRKADSAFVHKVIRQYDNYVEYDQCLQA